MEKDLLNYLIKIELMISKISSKEGYNELILSDNYKNILREIINKTGMLGASFSFVNVYTNEIKLLQNRNLQDEDKTLPYHDFPFFYNQEQKEDEINSLKRTITDLMFIGKRKVQKVENKKIDEAPEFLLNLPPNSILKEDHLQSFEKTLRKTNNYFFCNPGEVLFFQYIWFWLMRNVQFFGFFEKIDYLHQVKDFSNRFSIKSIFDNHYWSQIEDKYECPEKDIASEFHRLISDNIEKSEEVENLWLKTQKELNKITLTDYSFLDDWRFLGLSKNDYFYKKNLKELEIFVNHLNKLYNRNELTIDKNENKSSIHKQIIDTAISYLCEKNSCSPEIKTFDLLKLLHEKVRFPLIPFFFMTYFSDNKVPLIHFVFSVYNSNNYKYNLLTNNGKRVLNSGVFALIALKPIWTLDSYSHLNTIEEDAENKSKNELSEVEIKRLNIIQIIFQHLSKGLIEYGFIEKLIISKIKTEATKSAVAAIMARNLSHNIGSHVLSYLKSYIRSIPNTINEKFLLELQKLNNLSEPIYELKLTKEYKKLIKINEVDLDDSMEAPFLLGLGRFINYIQERQDFIATIATDYIPYYSTINCKDFIYDELNYDYKIERHKEKNKYKVENILLDRIAYSEGFDREKIAINFRKFNGLDKNHQDLESLREINFDLPGGIIGRQAIFSIIENIIRNTAKHGKRNKSSLTFTIDITEPTISSNSNFWEFTVTDNNENGIEALPKLLHALNEPFVDEMTARLIESNKGIKEMRISASWLRNESVTNKIDSSLNDLPILSIQLVNSDDDKKIIFDSRKHEVKDIFSQKLSSIELFDRLRLSSDIKANIRYTFYIRKAQKLAIITEQKFEDFIRNEDGNIIPIEENNEWEIFTVNQYKKGKNKNFQLILVDKELKKEEKDHIRKLTSTRCLYDIDLTELGQNIKKFEKDSLKKDIKFYKKEYKNRTFSYYLYKWVNKEYKRRFNGSELPKIAIVEKDINKIKYKDSISDKEYFREENISVYSSESEISNEKIIFRTHNDVANEFLDFKKHSNYNKFLFIEGISGNNSTDRLIRSEYLNNWWWLKMIESSLTSVLIFDERISSRLNNSSNISDAKYLNREIYDKKNIHIFNIVKSEDEERFYIVDIADEVIGEITYERLYLNLTINLLNHKDNCKIYFDRIGNFKKHDFVVIHQGLLDKICNTYWNTEVESGYEEEAKESGGLDNPRKIYEKDIYDEIRNAFSVYYEYIVHSGRSRPENIPDGALFVQYSSIEYALFDCKHSLTELLYSARHEN